MSGPARRLAELTFPEAERLKGAIALLPAGAIEAHGPHLPLATDVIIARTAAEHTARILADRGVPSVVLPSLVYSVAEYASEFPGTLSISKETATALVRDVCRATQRAGMAAVIVVNAHLEPAHIESLKEGVRLATEDGVKVAMPDITKKPHALRLGDEFKSGACHAGRYETSLVLAADPFVVRDIAAVLDPNPISLSRAIADGKSTFLEAGGRDAYFGDPASATAAEGLTLYIELADIFANAAIELLGEN